MTLRLVTVVGSLRQGSYNRMIAQTLPELAPSGVEIVAAPSIAGIPLYDSDLQAKGIPLQVTALGEAIQAADGVIIVTPEYNYSVPGVLKNAIDWLSRLSPQPLAGKPLAIQSASMGVMGGVRAQYHLRQTLIFLEALVLNKPEVMVGAAQNKVDIETGRLNDEPTRQFIAGQLEAFAAFIRKMS
ncbi:MAG TPA: NADPH-dependent FMN reductase [Candidatus Sulfotelmatobacter sp.]|jgi:chromate reductase|nr:NADPH-dependent FMN reductase [Candidatus Sulfotelmatobacter sp.]